MDNKYSQQEKEIIKESLKSINSPYEIITDLSQYQVIISQKEDYHEVHFKMPVKYVPLNSRSVYDIIDGIGVQSYPLANPQDYENPDGKYTQFIPSKEETKQINFVVKALIQAKEIENSDTPKKYKNFIIYERSDLYAVEIDTYGDTHVLYEVNKKTGMVTNLGHMHYDPPPEF